MDTNLLSQDVKYLKGVGPNRAKVLGEELKVFTVRDLLYTFPYKYIDRSVVYTISQIQEGMPFVQLKGQILDFETEGAGRKRRLKAVFTDGTGYVELVWFNGLKYVEKNYKVNHPYLLLGRPGSWNGRFSFAHPELESLEKQRQENAEMRPFYHITERMKRAGFTSKLMGELIANAFSAIGDNIPENLPDYLKSEYNLIDLPLALRNIHYPSSAEQIPLCSRRLKFEELFFLQLDILRYTKNRQLKYAGYVFPKIGRAFLEFYEKNLPFPLTGAQQRVIKEIRKDMATGRQMNRLLQGDVGSGKTLVALMCCLIAIDNGFQACIMAPTEILAEQHLSTIRHFLTSLPVETALLTGSTPAGSRKDILNRTASGEIQILIGTHALIEPTLHFLNLGFVVIDEQHRFGVKQRAKLWEKSANPPHVLVMTATPIPRTLAMTVYGDLDVSVIDELPPGRKPVKTIHYYSDLQHKIIDGLRGQLRDGRQVYIVFPLIEKSEKTDLQNLETGFLRVQAAFPEYKVGKLHGKMNPQDKDAAISRFANRETQILVSTTVIEVGVNVPNATVMVIENAERFGLAQLHQLRGRVGRGGDQSYCLLVTKRQLSATTRRRIQTMVETTDGFEIAEEDMKLRGPGDLEGTAQSGLPFELKIANVIKDVDLMAQARSAAQKLLQQDPYENLPQNDMVWQHLRGRKQETNFSKIS